MFKKLVITAVFATCAMSVQAKPTEKQKIVDLVKSSSDDLKVYSSDGKRFYQKEITINDKGGLDVRVREKYLPAITDGINKTHRTSYFGITPKTLRYIGKIGKATNAVGIGLLMLDVLGTGLDDYNVTPEGNVNYTVHVKGKYCTAYANQRLCNDDPQTLCQNWLELANSRNNSRYVFADSVRGTESHCLVYGGTSKFNGNAGSAVTKNIPEKRVMSEREFDEAVRALAKAGNINAKQVILDAGKDEIDTGKHDDAVERLADDISSDDTTDEPQPDNPPSDDDSTSPKPDDETTDKDKTDDKTDDTAQDKDKTDTAPKTDNNGNFELPPFCDWATIVCDFIGTKPDMTDESLPTKDIPLKTPAEFDKDYVDFVGQCPADINVDIDLAFAKHTISYSFTLICDFVQNYLGIVIIFGAYLFATLHISSAFKI